MRRVEYTDDRGYRKVVLLRSGDDDPRIGVPVGPPDLEEFDWEGFKKDLNNALVERGLLTWEDLVNQQNGLRGAILQAARKRLALLYRRERSQT